MRTNDSSSGREQKISLALCLPSNRRAWRDVSSLGTRQNTTSELEITAESAFFTSALARTSACIFTVISAVGISIVFIGLIIIIQTGLSQTMLEAVASLL